MEAKIHTRAQAARILEISGARVRELAAKGRISGAQKLDNNTWIFVGQPAILPPANLGGRPRGSGIHQEITGTYSSVLTARDAEESLMSRCATIAQSAKSTASDKTEANVARVAGMILRSTFQRESRNLAQASEAYFAKHLDERLPAVTIVREGWVFSLPRLRDSLSRRLETKGRK